MDNILKNKNGYSFIEMIVSLALFSVVFLMIITIYLSMIKSQRSVIATQNIQESMKFVFEVMSKEIRAAKKSDNACVGAFIPDEALPNKVYNTTFASSTLYFENKYGECVFYFLEDDAGVSRLKIERAGLSMFVTPRNINVENLSFFAYDDDVGAFHSMQPYVTIRMDVETYGGKQIHKQRTSLQTSISSRYYE